MMDEQLRDNVERLIRRPGEAPAEDFLARLEGRLGSPRAPRRAWFPAAVAAAAVLAATSWLVFRSPAETPGPAQDGGAEFDDPVHSEDSWKILGALLLKARVEETDGRLRVLLPYEGKDPSGWIEADLAATPGNRAALEDLKRRAESPEATAGLESVRRVLTEAAGLRDPERRVALLNTLRTREHLPFLRVFEVGEGVPANLRGPACDLLNEILWGDCAALRKDIRDFIETNDYYMLRAINSKATSEHARGAIDLAHRALRGPWRSSINLAMSYLDDEKETTGAWGPRLRAQNALTLLIEITDRFTSSIRPGQPDHNAKVRQDWRAWWAEARKRDPSVWCDGLAPSQKADLRDAWLPPIGEFESAETIRPPEPTEAGRALAKRLGLKAAPYLLRMICVDPPRSTLWETGTVEFNHAALKLLHEAAGFGFGSFDPSLRRPEGANRVLLWAWKRWAAKHLGGLAVDYPGDAEGVQVVAQVNERKILRDEVDVLRILESMRQGRVVEPWEALYELIHLAFSEEIVARDGRGIPKVRLDAERDRLEKGIAPDLLKRMRALADLEPGLFDRLVLKAPHVGRAEVRAHERKGTDEEWIRGQKDIRIRLLDKPLADQLLGERETDPLMTHVIKK